jgi:ferredoxin
MANSALKVPDNIPGRFYVDETCVDCDACRQVAPDNIALNSEAGYSYFFKQPENEAELDLCLDAVDVCPTESVGDSNDD